MEIPSSARHRLFVRKIASVGAATVEIWKCAGMTVPADSGLTMRHIARQVICKLGDVLRQDDPTLSPAQARVKAVRETEEGREWAALENHPHANLTPQAFFAKQEELELLAGCGVTSWDGLVVKLTRDYQRTAGADHQAARVWVRKHRGAVVEMARLERA